MAPDANPVDTVEFGPLVEGGSSVGQAVAPVMASAPNTPGGKAPPAAVPVMCSIILTPAPA